MIIDSHRNPLEVTLYHLELLEEFPFGEFRPLLWGRCGNALHHVRDVECERRLVRDSIIENRLDAIVESIQLCHEIRMTSNRPRALVVAPSSLPSIEKTDVRNEVEKAEDPEHDYDDQLCLGRDVYEEKRDKAHGDESDDDIDRTHAGTSLRPRRHNAARRDGECSNLSGASRDVSHKAFRAGSAKLLPVGLCRGGFVNVTEEGPTYGRENVRDRLRRRLLVRGTNREIGEESGGLHRPHLHLQRGEGRRGASSTHLRWRSEERERASRNSREVAHVATLSTNGRGSLLRVRRMGR